MLKKRTQPVRKESEYKTNVTLMNEEHTINVIEEERIRVPSPTTKIKIARMSINDDRASS